MVSKISLVYYKISLKRTVIGHLVFLLDMIRTICSRHHLADTILCRSPTGLLSVSQVHLHHQSAVQGNVTRP